MDYDLIPANAGAPTSNLLLPSIILKAGAKAANRLAEFFAAYIRNGGTREVYARAVGRFCHWCELRAVGLTASNRWWWPLMWSNSLRNWPNRPSSSASQRSGCSSTFS